MDGSSNFLAARGSRPFCHTARTRDLNAQFESRPFPLPDADERSSRDRPVSRVCKCAHFEDRGWVRQFKHAPPSGYSTAYEKRKDGWCTRCDAPTKAQPEMDWGDACRMFRKKKRGKSPSEKTETSSSSSSSSSSHSKRKKRKKNSDARSPPETGKGSDAIDLEEASGSDAPAKDTTNSEVEKAKAEALQKVLKIKDGGLDEEERRRQFRKLLREWHPDKHEDKELATAVFQFLQKAKGVF